MELNIINTESNSRLISQATEFTPALNPRDVVNTQIIPQGLMSAAGPSTSNFQQAKQCVDRLITQPTAAHSQSVRGYTPYNYQLVGNVDLLASEEFQPQLTPLDLSHSNIINTRPDAAEFHFPPGERALTSRNLTAVVHRGTRPASSSTEASSDALLSVSDVDLSNLTSAFERSFISTNCSTISSIGLSTASTLELPGTSAQSLQQQITILPSGVEITGIVTPPGVYNDPNLTLFNLLGMTTEDLEQYRKINAVASMMILEDSIGKTREQLENIFQHYEAQNYVVPEDEKDLRFRLNELFSASLKGIESYLPNEIFEPAMNVEDINFGQDLTDAEKKLIISQSPVTELINNANPIISENINSIVRDRMRRVLGIGFLSSSTLLNMVLDAINRKLQTHVPTASAAASQFLEVQQEREYFSRLKSFLDSLKISFLVMGDNAIESEINCEGLPFGRRGLNISIIHQLVSNFDISSKKLLIMGLYLNTQLSAISHTGEMGDTSFLEYLPDDVLEMMFNPNNNYKFGIPEYNLTTLEDVKTIMNNGYSNGHKHSELNKFFGWVENIACIMGSNADLARMLFDNTAADTLSLRSIAQRITDKNNGVQGVTLDKDFIKYAIIELCNKRVSSGIYKNIKSHIEIVFEFNQLKLDNILNYISQELGIKIVLAGEGKALGHYNLSGEYRPGSYPQGWHIILTPDSIYSSNNTARSSPEPKKHYGENHNMLHQLLNLRYETSIPKVEINRKLFQHQLKMLRIYSNPSVQDKQNI